jgi:hypothetical protein
MAGGGAANLASALPTDCSFARPLDGLFWMLAFPEIYSAFQYLIIVHQPIFAGIKPIGRLKTST